MATDKRPVVKTAQRPIFFLVGSCRPHIILKGRTRTKMSNATLQLPCTMAIGVILLHLAKTFLFAQGFPGPGEQKYAINGTFVK